MHTDLNMNRNVKNAQRGDAEAGLIPAEAWALSVLLKGTLAYDRRGQDSTLYATVDPMQ